MLTALILIIALAGIVIASRRWPDVEAKLWPDAVNVPEREARSGLDEATEPVADSIAEPVVEKTANGLMSKKAIRTEPDVEPSAVATASPSFLDDDEDDDTTPEPVTELGTNETGDTGTGSTDTELTATDEPSLAAPAASPTRAVPGPRVMGEPARPSQPAYVDATKRVTESFEQLSSEADRAWQERKYDKAEQACLKILIQQPKNHKYMTRIGQIYQETGDLEDAREAFESAKKLDPKNFFVLNRLSEVERMISDKGGRTTAKQPVAK